MSGGSDRVVDFFPNVAGGVLFEIIVHCEALREGEGRTFAVVIDIFHGESLTVEADDVTWGCRLLFDNQIGDRQ